MWVLGRCGGGADEAIARELAAAGINAVPISLAGLERPAGVEPTADALLACYAYPGEFAADALDAAASLGGVPVMRVAGTWCEGQGRSTPAHRGTLWCYWHEVAAALGELLGRSTRTPVLPPTTGSGLIELITQDYETADAIANSLAEAGLKSAWNPAAGSGVLLTGVSLSVWVEGQLHGLAAARLADFCRRQRARGASTLLLLDFPRVDEIDLAGRIGVDAVLARPQRPGELTRNAWRLVARARSARSWVPAPPRRAA